MPTFAKALDGDFTGLIESGTSPSWSIQIAEANVDIEYRVFNTTAGGDGNTKHQSSKRYTYVVNGEGWYYDETNSDYIHITGTQGTVAGALLGRVSGAILVKRYPIIEVTADADALPDRVFDQGHPVYFGTCRGFLQSTETPGDTDPNDVDGTNGTEGQTLTLPMGSGNISETAIFRQLSQQPNFRLGHAVGVNYGFQYTNVTEASAAGPFATSQFSATITLDNGQTQTGTVIFDELRADLNYDLGGPVPMRFKGKFTGTVSFA